MHSLSATVTLPMLVKALGTQNDYTTAASVDQIPKHVSCGLMFGRAELIAPVAARSRQRSSSPTR